ncbi:DUF2971 domain-containing protein [Ruegeria atlantica]|uniref:DUF2971 domain-containing protein n=1 Tax=Ruegeria atlantica TaxID=81569 RepID=UPI00147B868E|nr:DUF2971 domain-containing protein [Ruegeria atlantica]
MDELQAKLARLFMPYAMDRVEAVEAENTKFVHYTSAFAATQIIKNEEVWLRNALVMNDFSEVQHGEMCLAESWKDEEVGGRLRTLLSELADDLADRLAETFDSHSTERTVQSFLMSVSEHGNPDIAEEKYGRLSMWRAYGGDTNVALIFNNSPFRSEEVKLQAFSSPVLYADYDGFKEEFVRLVKGLEAEFDLLNEIGPDEVFKQLYWAFHMASLSTKHPGFSEEREWRVIYSPTLFGRSPIMKEEIETIGGVPQKVIKLPLKADATTGYSGYAVKEILEEIIVGPTETSWPIYESLAMLLDENGVDDAWGKVRRSDIPLRR